ncbi:MAG: amino acid--tRNA ligase-related protein, partial [Kiritimatiellia bacterium]
MNDTGAISLEALQRRAQLLHTLRTFFDQRAFIEVETPVRIPAPANEAFLEPPPSGDCWLRTSPELHMKRLLAHGAERIWQMGPCFRSNERGRKHNPEFTLLE